MSNARNLNNRINRLEQTLGTLACNCPNNAEPSWPGHQPDPTCPTCGGERLIYSLAHHPGPGEPLIRQALPIIKKAYASNTHPDLKKLSDQELRQLKTALQAVEQTPPLQDRAPPKTKPQP